MKRYLFVLLVLCMQTMLCGAESFVLKGKVTDENRNGIELATISCVKQGVVKMANFKGEFKITLQSADSVEIRFSMVGYQTRKRTLFKPHGTVTMNIILPGIELNEVVVTERRRQTGTEEKIDVKGVKTMPSVTGNGVEELIQQQAGVSTHNELSSQYNVRGGSFDENSVYINDVEVYRPMLVRSGEQEGLSIINPDMVESISFSAGGFAAQYADKMSSALDIKYKRVTPNLNIDAKSKSKVKPYIEGAVGGSLLGANAYLGLGTKTLSWTNGLRYKTTRYLLGSLETTGEYRPNQLDYQTYLSWSPNKSWTLDIIGNISENHYNFEPHDRETKFGTLEDVHTFTVYFDGQEKDLFRTFFGSVALTRHIGERTNVSLSASAFHSKEQETYDIQGQYWLDETGAAENLGVGTYFEHARNYLTYNVASLKLSADTRFKGHLVKGGVTYKNERVDEDSREYEMRDSAGYSMPHTSDALNLIYSLRSKNSLNSNKVEVFLQDTYKFKGRNNETFYTLNYGLRFSYWDYNGESLLSPRASLTVIPKFNPDLTFRFATGLYYQTPFYKELRDTVTTGGVTRVVLNPNIKSQRSIHFIAGTDYRFRVNDRPYKFSAEAYFKALSDVIPYNVSNLKISYYGENLCSGYIAGIDAKIYGEFVPGADSWLSVGYMAAKQKLNGKTIPMPTDQGLSANLFFTDFFPGTTDWKMTLKGSYVGGLPFGPPHTGLEKQVFRAPAYKRVDIGMSYRAYNNDDGDNHKKDTHAFFRNIWLELDCFNIFGFNNVNSYYWVTDVTNQQYAVPNYLTGRQLNFRVLFEF
ncbi:MAG: carboxypeptidase-like regulatory domain-containing protein [Prevotella sp.]|nr:carboxypeptidase-like regulatory domain-containing protein [Candidatus Equicola stercoris]